MLKLLYFVPCEKLIISEDGLVTVVNILDGINVEEDSKLEENSAIQYQWESMALWYRDSDEDIERQFEQKVELFRPDNELAFTAPSPFHSTPETTSFRVIHKVGAFPIGMEGTLWLKLSIRYVGEENEWQEAAQFPLVVKHLPKSGGQSENEVATNQ